MPPRTKKKRNNKKGSVTPHSPNEDTHVRGRTAYVFHASERSWTKALVDGFLCAPSHRMPAMLESINPAFVEDLCTLPSGGKKLYISETELVPTDLFVVLSTRWPRSGKEGSFATYGPIHARVGPLLEDGRSFPARVPIDTRFFYKALLNVRIAEGASDSDEIMKMMKEQGAVTKFVLGGTLM